MEILVITTAMPFVLLAIGAIVYKKKLHYRERPTRLSNFLKPVNN